MLAFHHIRIQQNKTNIKRLQNQTPRQIPQTQKSKPNKYIKKDFHKNSYKINQC